MTSFVAKVSHPQDIREVDALARQLATLRCMNVPSRVPMLVAHATAQEVCLKLWVVVNATACTDRLKIRLKG